ncbi:hypothetical protein GCK32_022642, partial [Trichostrongylus colubriformis]
SSVIKSLSKVSLYGLRRPTIRTLVYTPVRPLTSTQPVEKPANR